MPKVFFDRHYNLVKEDTRDYGGEIDRKIDLVMAAIEKGSLSKEEGVELLQFFLAKEITKEAHLLAATSFSSLSKNTKKNPFFFLLNHSTSVERYA